MRDKLFVGGTGIAIKTDKVEIWSTRVSETLMAAGYKSQPIDKRRSCVVVVFTKNEDDVPVTMATYGEEGEVCCIISLLSYSLQMYKSYFSQQIM